MADTHKNQYAHRFCEIMQDLINPISQLQFGVIKMLNANLVEVFINEGIEVDLQMVQGFEEMLDELLLGHYGLLLNEKHPHTYSKEAEEYFAHMNNLDAMAVVMYTRFTDIASKYLQSFHETSSWKMKVFYNRDKALGWLEKQMG